MSDSREKNPVDLDHWLEANRADDLVKKLKKLGVDLSSSIEGLISRHGSVSRAANVGSAVVLHRDDLDEVQSAVKELNGYADALRKVIKDIRDASWALEEEADRQIAEEEAYQKSQKK